MSVVRGHDNVFLSDSTPSPAHTAFRSSFFSGGRFRLPRAWLYLAAAAAGSAACVTLASPEFLAERTRIGKGVKAWDLPLALIMGRIDSYVILPEKSV